MGRLIDADALIEKLQRNSAFGMVRNAADKNVYEIIAEQPTAYDISKVVAEMKERVEKFDCIKCKHYDDEKYVCNAEKSCIDYTFECLYDIAKRGGVE